MKLGKTLMVAVALMTIAASAAYANVQYTTGSNLDFVAPNARTGLVGNVTFNAITAGTIGGATSGGEIIVISYGGAQISVTGTVGVVLQTPVVYLLFGNTAGMSCGAALCSATPTAVPIATATTAQNFSAYYPANGGIAATPAIDLDGDTLNEQVTVALNPNSVTIAISGAAGLDALQIAAANIMEVGGIRLNVVPVTGGSTVGAFLPAQIMAVANQVSVTNQAPNVGNVVDPIALSGTAIGATSIPNGPLPGTLLLRPPIVFSTGGVAIGPTCITPGPPGTARAMVLIGEINNFADAFETMGAANPTQLILKIAGVPAGLTYAASAVDAAAPVGTTSPTVTAAINTTLTGQTGTTATIVINISAQNAVLLEVIGVTIDFSSAAATTIAEATANITATLGPEATAAQLAAIAPSGAGIVLGSLRYFDNPEPGVLFLNVTQLKTELLSTYNTYSPGSTGFNTGFAIANTSGFLGITGQSGTITVILYPSDGSASKTFTTSATDKPGLGLDANGKLPVGATWQVLLSQLLGPAGITGSFSGFVRFTSNFTNAHGINFIADQNFATQSQGFPMLVLPFGTAASPRPATTPEGLDN